MSKRPPPSQPPDYEVGYGRPPKDKRFKPGRSGNPRGRPRQPKGSAALLHKTLSRKVRISENGTTKSLPLEEVIITQLAAKAAKGDPRATKLLFDLKDRYYSSPERPQVVIQLSPDDLKL